MKLHFFIFAVVVRAAAVVYDTLPDIPGSYSYATLHGLEGIDYAIQDGTSTIDSVPNCGPSRILGAVEGSVSLTDGSACPAADSVIADKVMDIRLLVDVAVADINSEYFQNDETHSMAVSNKRAVTTFDSIARSLHIFLTTLEQRVCRFRLSSASMTGQGIGSFLRSYVDLRNQLGFPYLNTYIGNFQAQDRMVIEAVTQIQNMIQETSSGSLPLTCHELTPGQRSRYDVHRMHAAVQIPIPAIKENFLMPVEDVISNFGRDTVVSGWIERGVVRSGDELELVGIVDSFISTCIEVQMVSGRVIEEGHAGQNVNMLLRGVKKEEIQPGMVLATPGSILPRTKFASVVYVLTKGEGGRHTPFAKGYRPEVYIHTTDVTATIELPDGEDLVFPGDNVNIVFTLVYPLALEVGLHFSVRENHITVGEGVITEVIS